MFRQKKIHPTWSMSPGLLPPGAQVWKLCLAMRYRSGHDWTGAISKGLGIWFYLDFFFKKRLGKNPSIVFGSPKSADFLSVVNQHEFLSKFGGATIQVWGGDKFPKYIRQKGTISLKKKPPKHGIIGI